MHKINQMALISHPDCLLHEMGESHPECPERLISISTELERTELIKKLKYYPAPLASKEEIARVHARNYSEQIFELGKTTKTLTELDPDTYMNPYTLNAALRAAGSLVLAVDLIMQGKVKAAFCNVRPPGHHAESARAMGFCFFNNLAIGVMHALEKYQLKRIAIIDFDVHHGNGTEEIFKNEPRVLLCSSFQHPFYPFSGSTTQSSHILNLPLASGTTGKDTLIKMREYWIPALHTFKPEMLFFSAGFDAHAEDPLANLLWEDADYAAITREFKQIADEFCDGRTVSTLEGGYNLEVLGAAAAAHIKALL